MNLLALAHALPTPFQDPAATDVEDDAADTILDSLYALWHEFLAALPNYGIAIVVLMMTWVVASLLTRLLSLFVRRMKLRNSLQDLFRQLAYMVLWVVGILVAAVVAFPGVTVGKLLTVLGIGSIAIGFAFKDIFENFFAGVLILWRFPFENGDVIETGEIFGRVERTTIRMTEIRQPDGQLVVLPNAHLFKNPVNIVTSQDLRRIDITCGVAYGEDVDASRTVIEQAVRGCPTVAQGEEVQVFAKEFNSSSVDFQVAWWTGSQPVEVRRSRDEVVAAIKRALDEHGIEIPFPYRTLVFKQPVTFVDEA